MADRDVEKRLSDSHMPPGRIFEVKWLLLNVAQGARARIVSATPGILKSLTRSKVKNKDA